MNFDHRIALAGQGVNALGALAGGIQTADARNQVQHGNALARLFQEQGPGIMQGEQGALNRLAQLDPMAGLGVQESRLGMDAVRQTMEAQAAQMSREERAFAAAELGRALGRGVPYLRSGDLAGFNSVLAENGVPEVDTIEEAQVMVAESEISYGILTRLNEMNAGPSFRRATPEEAGAYGAVGGQFGPDGRFYPIDPSTAGNDARELEIQRLMRDLDLTRDQATAVAYGVVGRDRDPVTGDPSFFDLRGAFGENSGATASPSASPANAPQEFPSVFNQSAANPAAPQRPETPSRAVIPTDGADYRGATGLEGAVTGTVNALTDFFFGMRPFQEQGRARTALNNVRTRTLTTLATVSMAGRPSNYAMQMYEQNVVANSNFSGPDGALDTAQQTLSFLDGLIAENQAILGERVAPAVRSEAQRNISSLEGLRDDYRILVSEFGGGSGGGGDFSNMDADALLAVDPASLSQQERDAYEARLDALLSR